MLVKFDKYITCQANVKAVTSAHCPQCKMVTALIGNGITQWYFIIYFKTL